MLRREYVVQGLESSAKTGKFVVKKLGVLLNYDELACTLSINDREDKQFTIPLDEVLEDIKKYDKQN